MNRIHGRYLDLSVMCLEQRCLTAGSDIVRGNEGLIDEERERKIK